MSKREATDAIKNGHSIFVNDLQGLGYIPEGVLNWIALMGWGVPEGDVLSLDEMITRFEIQNLTPSPAAINFAKLDHFNATHIRKLQTKDLAKRVKPYFLQEGLDVDDIKLLKIVPLIRERMVTLDDSLPFAAWFFKESIQPNPNDLIAKGLAPADSLNIFRQVYEIINNLPDITPAISEPPMRALVEQLGLSPNQVFGILRAAITGQTVSPPLFDSMEIVGKEKVLERIKNAVDILEKI
jgi:glutamyl-tRNA synthetase